MHIFLVDREDHLAPILIGAEEGEELVYGVALRELHDEHKHADDGHDGEDRLLMLAEVVERFESHSRPHVAATMPSAGLDTLRKDGVWMIADHPQSSDCIDSGSWYNSIQGTSSYAFSEATP